MPKYLWCLPVLCYGLLVIGCVDDDDGADGDNGSGGDAPTYDDWNQLTVGGYDGIDLLIVVDNSGSMDQEQHLLATGIFTLVSSLTDPVAGDDWPYSAVENMRVAVVSSDMGLQYGDNGSTDGFPFNSELPSCTDQDPRGDDGEFQIYTSGMTVVVESGMIGCADDGAQCPPGWACQGGGCVSPSGGAEAVNCPGIGTLWAETGSSAENTDLACQTACLSNLGTGGCGVEQQLEASVRALTRGGNENFIVDSHLLAVLIVSDEEDCSIEDRGLFETMEWTSKTLVSNSDPNSGLLNTSCNLPQSNEENFLFETSRYAQRFGELKSHAGGVVFAAIVGVPSGSDSPCQGRGDELSDCLGDADMSLETMIFESYGTPFKHFRPACSRVEGDVEVTTARPGRRYVKVAESFGPNGYVYSICNADWTPGMEGIARTIAANLDAGGCFPKRLPWDMGTETVGNCEFIAIVEPPLGTPTDVDIPCPKGFEEDYDFKEIWNGSSGERVRLGCKLPKIAAPLECEEADQVAEAANESGWYYCERGRSCEYQVALTEAAKDLVRGLELGIGCYY